MKLFFSVANNCENLKSKINEGKIKNFEITKIPSITLNPFRSSKRSSGAILRK